MGILLADNFQYQGRKPLDSRIICETIADMKSMAESIIYEGIMVYNKETKRYYSFNPSNADDPTLGKWREFQADGSGNALILDYIQDTEYLKNTLIIYDNKLYVAAKDFTSSNLGPNIEDDFNLDLAANNLFTVSADSDMASIQEYIQDTSYKKDALIYYGDRLGRASKDFISDNTKASVLESFQADVSANNIVVDQIDISELNEQLLKALPIVAFVTKKDIPRFETNMKIAGTIPTFRDGSQLSTEEKLGCNFLYIIDNNGELTGLAIVLNYSEAADEFTVNAMKYGVGTADNILPTDKKLTKRTVGETQVIYKDDLLNPLFIVKATPPIDNTKLWYESTELDASDVSVGPITVKKYNDTTSAWDLTETIDVKDSQVVKNGNGAEWQYYRIQNDGNVFISLAKWQLVYDTDQILGKIINIDTTTHEVTIKTIHANDTSEPSLTEDIQANVAIGAAAANFKYPEGMTFTEFVKKIALKDIPAVFNLTATNSGLKKKGTTINGTTLLAAITNLGNVAINKIKFYIGNTLLGEENYMDGTTSYTYSYTDPITIDTTFSAIVEQDKGYTSTKAVKFTFVNPTYVGEVSSLTPTVTEIETLTEILKENKNGNYTVTMNDARTCYAYPSSMGNLTSIKDKNNFEYINSYTKSTATINGETYNVYVLTDQVTAENFTWSFN